ncbi:hypothetical protein [Geopsychrobacter electrodiphilus]|uniref:hypothetical protein n=1 Tax=Geopsychrobacter electrodiphilus TaxID=225196 RepID=UPI0003666E79|nr:hypothetical protein [Geopsychrobacter electrodiphilus]
MLIRGMILMLLVLLAGCGPIIGASMVAGGGVKDFTVVDGQLQNLKAGSTAVIVGPFAKTEQAYYICRGEETANFTSAFNSLGLFQADFYLGDRFAETAKKLAHLKTMTPAQIQSELGLKAAPELLITGVILHRSTVAAPAQGILMDVGYRLEFYDLQTRQTTTIEVQVKDLFQDCITDVVSDLMTRITGH